MKMEYIQLGSSDLKVSKICLGCMGFGDAKKGMHSWTLSYEKSKEIIQYAYNQGINFFDTAMAYQGGSSEEYLGKAIRETAKREDVVIATKFHGRTQEQIEMGVSAKQHIESCLDMSLKRLQMDYVDLYILHAWDAYTPIEETLEALNEMIRKGKIRYIGISNCYAWQIAKANEIARAKNLQPFISVQGHYNLIFREEEREMKPYCDLHHIAMTPYSALASGRLAKHPGEKSQRLMDDTYAKGKYDRSADIDLPIIHRVEELAEKHQVSMSEIALSWLMSQVTSPIVGATKLSHIDSAVSAVNLKLSKDEMDYLEECYYPHPLVGVMAEKNDLV